MLNSLFKIFLCLCFVAISISGIAQNRSYYNKLKTNKKASIAYSKKLLSELKSNKENSIDKLLITKEQIVRQKEVLAILNKELQLIDEEIIKDEAKVSSLMNESIRIKKEYAELIKFSYINLSAQNRMIYIFSAENFNKAYRRMLYLKQMTNYRKSRFIKIDENLKATDSTLNLLKLKRNEKEKLQAERKISVDSLEKVRINLNSIINNTLGEIDQIQGLIQAENLKKEETKRNVTTQILKQEENKTLNAPKNIVKLDENLTNRFENARKHHIWPLSKFVVLHHYGDYPHPILEHVVVKNDGVELGSNSGVNVHCIFDGKVVNVITIPGDGISVLVGHGEYYSVYSKIERPLIKAGDVVQKGQVIGKLGSRDKVARLNFQLWKGKEKLNPELWLKRQ